MTGLLSQVSYCPNLRQGRGDHDALRFVEAPPVEVEAESEFGEGIPKARLDAGQGRRSRISIQDQQRKRLRPKASRAIFACPLPQSVLELRAAFKWKAISKMDLAREPAHAGIAGTSDTSEAGGSR